MSASKIVVRNVVSVEEKSGLTLQNGGEGDGGGGGGDGGGEGGGEDFLSSLETKTIHLNTRNPRSKVTVAARDEGTGTDHQAKKKQRSAHIESRHATHFDVSLF